MRDAMKRVTGNIVNKNTNYKEGFMQFRKSILLLVLGCVFLSSSAFGLTWGDFSYEVSGSTVIITGYTGTGGNVVIPDTIDGMPVVSIANVAFRQNITITYMTIPSSVSSIGEEAFSGCTGLTAAYFFGNAPTMGSNVFLNCASGFKIYYLAGVTGFTNPWYGYPTGSVSSQ